MEAKLNQPKLSKESLEYLGWKKSKDAKLAQIIPLMSEEDKTDYMCHFFGIGSIHRTGSEFAIMGSSKSIKRYEDFRDSMLEKYEKG